MATTPSTKKEATTGQDYFELRIPKVVNGRVPLSLTIVLMLGAYLAGLITMRFILDSAKSGKVADATSAYIAYAKDLKLDEKQFTECLESGKYASSVTGDMNNAEQFQVSATPTFFVNGRPLIGAQPYEIFDAMIQQELSGNRSPLTPEEASGPAQMNVGKGNLPVLGKDDAKITIVEFSDFQCPFCESFFTSTYPELKKNYIDTGIAQLTFRHYPLTGIHPNAEKAHQASECANEQGKFWEYHDKLFQTQTDWTDLPLVSASES